jgi:hypothetical protein
MQDRITITSYYLASFILILFGYYKYIVPIYGYSGYILDYNTSKILEAGCLTTLISLILPKGFEKPSDILLHLQFMFPITPMLVLYGAVDYPRLFLYCTIFAFLAIAATSRIEIPAVRVCNLSLTGLQIILLTTAWLIISSIIYFGGLKYINFNLTAIYDYRSDAASNLPGIYGYLSPLTSKVLLPFSLLLAVINKNWVFVIAAFFGSIMMFGLTAHKGPIFYPITVLALYFILKKDRIIILLITGYVSIIIISILDFSTGIFDNWFGSLMLRRTIITPAGLNYSYYQLFSEIPFVFWSESKITLGLLDYPYDIPSSMLVGREIYGIETLNANTGWIGSGYSNGGFFGIILYAMLIGILFSILNGYSYLIEKRILVSIIAPPMLALMMSSDLPTAFLNHGVILAVIIFSLFTAKGNHPQL